MPSMKPPRALCAALAADPVLEEYARDAISHMKAGHRRSRGNDLAGTVRNGHQHLTWPDGVLAMQHENIAPVKGRGMHADQHLMRAGLGNRNFHLLHGEGPLARCADELVLLLRGWQRHRHHRCAAGQARQEQGQKCCGPNRRGPAGGVE
jgi:hypothetical protein